MASQQIRSILPSTMQRTAAFLLSLLAYGFCAPRSLPRRQSSTTKCVWPCDSNVGLNWDEPLQPPIKSKSSDAFEISVDWGTVSSVSKCTTTLQVVSNPILDREFTSLNGTTFRNPIHDQAWQSLADLQADLVRFVPWYPYPKKSVAELDAPVAGHFTSWNFTDIIPNFYDFMDGVYKNNHSTVLNFVQWVTMGFCTIFSTVVSQ